MSVITRIEREVRRAAAGDALDISVTPDSLSARVYRGGKLIADISRRVVRGRIVEYDVIRRGGERVRNAARRASMDAAIQHGMDISIHANTPDAVAQAVRRGGVLTRSKYGAIGETELVRAGMHDAPPQAVIVPTADHHSVALYRGASGYADTIADVSIGAAAIAAEHGAATASAIGRIIEARNDNLMRMIGQAPTGAGIGWIRQRLTPINNEAWAAIERATRAGRSNAGRDIRTYIGGHRVLRVALGADPAPKLMQLPLKDVMDGAARQDMQRLLADVSQAIINGIPLRQPTQSMTAAARQGATIARTAVQQIAAARVSEMHEQLGVTRERYLATLDGKTSVTCATIDGREYPIGEGPMPPVHYNCRSTRVPVVGDDALTTRGTVGITDAEINEAASTMLGRRIRSRADVPRGSKGAYDQLRKKMMDKVTGTTPASISYADWLARQPRSFVQGLLGKERAEAYLSGKLSLDNMRDTTTGRVYTVGDLKARGLM